MIPLPTPSTCHPQHLTDPLEQLGSDIFQNHVLPLLDARSLARSAAVSRQWLALAASDTIWKPLCFALLTTRAHLPLKMSRLITPRTAFHEFSIIMEDARKVQLTPEEMCARIWEMRVKPTCGPYWHSLDPTSRGGIPLLRRFNCDYSVTAVWPNDPIWGGNESLWQFAYLKLSGEESKKQYVQINRWPHHQVIHLPDGRWRLDNSYASYTTCPDQKTNMASFLRGVTLELCCNCCHCGSEA